LFLIAPEWHQIPSYTEYERQQLTEVFGKFPDQVIWIFGERDRIFVAAYEIIMRFGGLLDVNLSDIRARINSFPGSKIEFHKIKHKNPLKHKPNYWLVDHVFIRECFSKGSGDNFEKFKLCRFLPYYIVFLKPLFGI
jgi:hypothetical protein